MIIDEIKKSNVEAIKNKDSNLRSIYSIIINKYMQLKSNHNAIRYWENVIMSKVKHGKLSNDKDELIYWMTGVTDGWIKFKM